MSSWWFGSGLWWLLKAGPWYGIAKYHFHVVYIFVDDNLFQVKSLLSKYIIEIMTRLSFNPPPLVQKRHTPQHQLVISMTARAMLLTLLSMRTTKPSSVITRYKTVLQSSPLHSRSACILCSSCHSLLFIWRHFPTSLELGPPVDTHPSHSYSSPTPLSPAESVAGSQPAPHSYSSSP